MRHLNAGRKLNADTQHRTAMRRNLARAIFTNGRIRTTKAKAKATRPYVEKLVTRARKALALKDVKPEAYVHQLRELRKEIPDRKVLKLLVEKIAPLCKDRPGGYTRILHEAKPHLGDGAPVVLWEFVDRPSSGEDAEAPEGAAEAKGGTKKKKARGRARSKEAAAS